MTLKEIIEHLDTLYMTLPSIESSGYGEKEAIDTLKKGVLYTRAYNTLVDADKYFVNLEVYVVALPDHDLSNRLEIQSTTLTSAKEIVQLLIKESFINALTDITFNPTTLQGSDQHEGWYFDIKISLEEDIDVCNNII